MNSKLISLLGALSLGLAASAAHAAPVLKADVTVTSGIVTVGDMFDDVGDLAGKAMFRAPLPGTTGMVSLDAVRNAAALAGVTEFTSEGVSRVRVARASTLVDTSVLGELIAADLRARGIAGDEVTVQAVFDTPDLGFDAEAVPAPAQLMSLRYMPGPETFSARFLIAGTDLPVDLTGRIDLLVEAPHLWEPGRPVPSCSRPTSRCGWCRSNSRRPRASRRWSN